MDTEGFNLWRSESEAGEYARVNPALIPAQGGPSLGASYAYTDTAVVPGVTYWYKLESVDIYGASTMHGPVSVTFTGPLAVALASFDAAQVGDAVQVAWETVSEVDNTGFNLYRSVEPDTVGDLLAFVPSEAPGSSQGAAYVYADTAVQPGQTYWYWLEDVDIHGNGALHGPVSVAVVSPTSIGLNSMATGAPIGPLPVGLVFVMLAAPLALAGSRRRRAHVR